MLACEGLGRTESSGIQSPSLTNGLMTVRL